MTEIRDPRFTELDRLIAAMEPEPEVLPRGRRQRGPRAVAPWQERRKRYLRATARYTQLKSEHSIA